MVTAGIKELKNQLSRYIGLEIVLRTADEPNDRLPHILSCRDHRPQMMLDKAVKSNH